MTDPAFCKHDPARSWNAAAAERSGWQHRRAGFNSKANQNLGQRLQPSQSSTVRARAGGTRAADRADRCGAGNKTSRSFCQQSLGQVSLVEFERPRRTRMARFLHNIHYAKFQTPRSGIATGNNCSGSGQIHEANLPRFQLGSGLGGSYTISPIGSGQWVTSTVTCTNSSCTRKACRKNWASARAVVTRLTTRAYLPRPTRQTCRSVSRIAHFTHDRVRPRTASVPPAAWHGER